MTRYDSTTIRLLGGVAAGGSGLLAATTPAAASVADAGLAQMGGGMMGGYGGYGGYGGGFGLGSLWMLWPLLLLVGLVLVGYWALGSGRAAGVAPSGGATGRDPAIDALRERYARGELSDDEFERRRTRLDRDGTQ